MKHLDLFSGIGGFALAANWAGWETIGFCDNEPFARRVIRKHWADTPIYEDIRDIKEKIGCDIITGGFPCQPFSVAGKQKGQEDDRYLWPEMLRVIAQEKPAWVVGENVANLVGMGLDTVRFDLEAQGYAVQPFIIPACAVGAPHRRDRVWIVAHSSRLLPGREIERAQRERTGERGESKSLADFHHQRPQGYGGLCECSDQRAVGPSSRPFKEARLPQSRLGGAPDGVPGWLDGSWESGTPRICGKIPNRVARLKGLGNAIVPQVAYKIFKAINQYEDKRRA